MTFASATFTGTAFTELSAADGNWTKQSGYTQDARVGSTGAYLTFHVDTDIGAYRHTATPPSANYTVSADFAKLGGTIAGTFMAVIGRAAAAADTYYFAQYDHDSTQLRLFKRVSGSNTQLGSAYSMTLTGTPVTVSLVMDGSSISATTNGVTRIGPVTDTAITAAGFAGLRGQSMREIGTADAASIDNFDATAIGGGGSSIGAGLVQPILLQSRLRGGLVR